MELRLTNGATVSRVHGETATELIAGFQFEMDAVEFANAKLASDAAREWFDSYYIVSNHNDGNITIIRHPKEEKRP